MRSLIVSANNDGAYIDDPHDVFVTEQSINMMTDHIVRSVPGITSYVFSRKGQFVFATRPSAEPREILESLYLELSYALTQVGKKHHEIRVLCDRTR